MRSWLSDTSEGGQCSEIVPDECLQPFVKQALVVKADESYLTYPEISSCPEFKAEGMLKDRLT